MTHPPAPDSVRVPSHPLCFGPGGEYLASASADYAIRLWEWKTDTKLTLFRMLNSNLDEVWGIAISPDGQFLAAVSRDCTVRLWNLEDSKATQPVTTHVLPASAKAVAFSPNGRMLAAGALDDTIRVWDTQGEEPFLEFEGHIAAVSSVSFSQCGRRLASGSWDKTIRVWDISSSRERLLRELSGGTGRVLSVAFHPSQKRLASAATTEVEKTVSIWDLDSWSCLYSFSLHNPPPSISTLSFSASGSRLALNLGDHAVLIWNLKLDSEIKAVTEHGIWSLATSLAEVSAKLFDNGQLPWAEGVRYSR